MIEIGNHPNKLCHPRPILLCVYSATTLIAEPVAKSICRIRTLYCYERDQLLIEKDFSVRLKYMSRNSLTAFLTCMTCKCLDAIGCTCSATSFYSWINCQFVSRNLADNTHIDHFDDSIPDSLSLLITERKTVFSQDSFTHFTFSIFIPHPSRNEWVVYWN